eukprot:9622190-Ditylum_brightwellii.AAC.1
MAQIQKDAELWGPLLWITGGLLEFIKSSYFIAVWIFSAEGHPSITTSLPPNIMHLTDAQESTSKLRRVSPTDGIKILGIRKAATLQETTERKLLHQKTGQYVKALSACPLQPHELGLSYKTI